MCFDCCTVLLPQGRAYTLPDVWIRPPLGGKGRKMTGQLEAHANGFRYLGPKGEVLDIMYRCASRLWKTAVFVLLDCVFPCDACIRMLGGAPHAARATCL
jgi:FACT complex subunit (SPT16/CDC68)